MKKIIYLILLLIPFSINALTYPETNSKVIEIYDINDNKELYSLYADHKVYIASLTKIATTITAIENINNLDEEVTITQEMLNTVSWDASIAGLKPGDKLTYRDLLYASMLPSGADATNSLAILISGNIKNYVEKMNELVNKLGLTNTHFVNTTGLDIDGHLSTAEEIRILLNYALQNPTFKEIYTTKEYTLSNGLKVKSTINTYTKNSNIDTSKILGSKTGFTENAGYCLSSLSNINGHEVIIITLKATHEGNNYYNIVDTINLINFLNNNYKEELLIEKDTVIKTLPVNLSKINEYEIKASKDISKYLPSDYNKDDLKIEYDGIESLNFLNKKDSKLGTIKYYYQDELFYQEEVTLNTKIKISIIKIIKRYFIIIIIFIILLFIYKKKTKKRRKRKKNHK
ncbi:MAG: D-alanyl-D-alanine carboxypeptidase [Bacilli bacterium]|nr:D-alanyl-D-alanine carboxypeptidase [Bacilli bacterium]